MRVCVIVGKFRFNGGGMRIIELLRIVVAGLPQSNVFQNFLDQPSPVSSMTSSDQATQLAKNLCCSGDIIFTQRVKPSDVPCYQAFDAFVSHKNDPCRNGNINSAEVFGNETVHPFTVEVLYSSTGFDAFKMIAESADEHTGIDCADRPANQMIFGL